MSKWKNAQFCWASENYVHTNTVCIWFFKIIVYYMFCRSFSFLYLPVTEWLATPTIFNLTMLRKPLLGNGEKPHPPDALGSAHSSAGLPHPRLGSGLCSAAESAQQQKVSFTSESGNFCKGSLQKLVAVETTLLQIFSSQISRKAWRI